MRGSGGVCAMGKQYTQKELIRVALARGWSISETRGKGSHVLAMKDGERPFPIPRTIKKGILESIKKRLGLADEKLQRASPEDPERGMPR